MLIGYARVSTLDQDPALQIDALKAAGCEKIFTEHMTGVKRDRPELNAALSYLREGDSLVIWKLDRLARSLKQLIETVETMEGQGVGFWSLTESIDTTTPNGVLFFHKRFADIAHVLNVDRRTIATHLKPLLQE